MLIPPPVNKLGAPPLTPDTMLRVSVHFLNQHCEGGAGGALKFVDRLLEWKHQALIHERARSGMDVMSLRADSGRFAWFALSFHGKRAILSHLAPSRSVSCHVAHGSARGKLVP